MAQKQYSFDFILNAVLNGGFSGTFTKAQQEFIRLGTEIKNLQAIQRDVKAYEKQAAAVQNTSQKLENLKRQYELVNKQIGETTGSTTALEREKLKLEQRITNTEAALEKQRQKLGETKDRLDAAGVSTTDLANKDAELTAKIQELTEEQKRAAEGAGEFGNAGVQAIEAVGGAIAAAGITGAMKSIADAYMECVEVAGNFEQAMSAVEAIANSNTSEMAALTAEAKELGATTKFTAQQSANAMEYMAMAGWDAREMLNGMDGVINLAAAAGEDLAQVSDIVTDNLSAFGLKASDTAHFADVLAAAAANSNTNISIMGETFKSSSSVAGALGYSVEDVAVMVGLMANNAVKGSRAGTALRNIFNGLLGGVTLTAEAFGELDYSAVNSDGSMKGLMETVKDLRDYFGQMTEAERVNNAMAIAGMRGYNGLLAILNATDEDFQSLYASISNCSGAAERMAKIKLDNLNGDVTIMNSAVEALQTTIGEQFNPELRELTRMKTELLAGMDQFIQENPVLAKGLMAGAGAFMALGTAIVGVNAAMKVFNALNLASLFTGPAGWLLAAAGGIAVATAAVVGYTEATRDGGPAVRELTEAARELNETMEEAKDACEDTAASTLAAANTADFYIEKLEEMENAQGESAAQSQEYQNTLALLLQTVPELSNCISQTADEYGRTTYTLETTTAALRANTEEWKRNALAQAQQKYMSDVMEQYGDVMLEAAKNEVGLTKAQYEYTEAQEKYNAAVRRMAELEKEANEAARRQNEEFGTMADMTAFLTQEYYDLQGSLESLGNEMDEARWSVRDHEEAIRRDKEALAEAEGEMAAAEQVVRQMAGALGLYTDAQEDVTAREQAVRDALGGTIEQAQRLADAYQEAYGAAEESFSGQFGLFDTAQADMDATVEAAQRALDSQLNYWKNYAGNIEVLKEKSAADLGVTQENYDALMAYVRTGTPEAVGLAASMARAINSGNTEAVSNLADTLGEVNEMRDQAARETADWTSGLSEQMDQLIHDIEEDVEALDLSDETKWYGMATIQEYIDAASGMLPDVRTAFQRLGEEAKNALWGRTRGGMDLSVPVPASWGPLNGYAGGTDNAPPGWAWVGEEGPELMRMRGGEQVLSNRQSAALARAELEEYRRFNSARPLELAGAELRAAADYDAYSRYAAVQDAGTRRPPLEVAGGGGAPAGAGKMEMHFHIAPGAAPETVDAWRDYVSRGELKSAVLEVMEDAEADMRRRSMV